MTTKAQTIQIFLPNGNPRGIKVADMLSSTVKAILFPRNQLDLALQRDELSKVGFYFLFGKSEGGRDIVYIGEAENCAERIKSHNRNKDFWNYAVVLISKTNAFTRSHIKYLEYYSILKAKEASRFALENSVEPNQPYVTESMEAEALDCFETAKVLLSTLGFPIFESISREAVSQTQLEIFILRGRGIEASGNLIDDGFVVFKDSFVKKETVPSCHQYLIDLRNLLLETEVLVEASNSYKFAEDYIFSSPSTAGGVILGRPTNGWKIWKNPEGKTLDEVKRRRD